MTATDLPSPSGPVRLRGGGLRYVEDPVWGTAHAEKLGWVSAARTDTRDRVSIFQRRSPEVVVRVPTFDHDITDVAGLARLGECLFAHTDTL